MASIRDQHNEWRDSLVMASFRGVMFHVEVSARTSGRRTVVHEYPKRNIPYSEDMGRQAVHWSFTGYILIGDKLLGNVMNNRNQLIVALERDDAGYLIHPSLTSPWDGAEGASSGGPMLVMCERYAVSDSRQKGGYFEFDLQFVEAGKAPNAPTVDTKGNLLSSSGAFESLAVSDLQKTLLGIQR